MRGSSPRMTTFLDGHFWMVIPGRCHRVRAKRGLVGRAPERRGTMLSPSFTRLGVLGVELAERAGNHEIIVVEHQGPRHAVLEQLERHGIDGRLLAFLG